MDVRKQFLSTALALALLAAGCSKSSEQSSSDTAGPDQAVTQFLAAVKKGDDKQAANLLTSLARRKIAESDTVVAPPGSETATFKILAVEVEGDEAQVGTDWSDLDSSGRMATDRIVWMLRKEQGYWRIAGMAARVFPDMPPTVISFEDPADMERKQQQAEAEMARRQAKQVPADNDADEKTTTR